MADTGLASERPLRSASFRWFLGGQSISLLGSAMSPVALAFAVLEATGSAAWLAAVTTAALVPMVAALLLGGGVADRHRRDSVLRLTSVGAGLTQAGVACVLLTHQHPAFLLPLCAFSGVFQGLTKPALRGIVANLAAGRGIQRASSLLASVRNTTKIIGPTTAGLLTASVGGGWAIAADAVSFLLAAVCFARMSLPDRPQRTADDPTMLGALREGWGYFSSQPWIWAVTLAFAVNNGFNLGVWQILGPVVANGTIGARGWGLVLSARGAGALLASVVMVKLTVRRPMGPALASMSLAAVPLILLGAGADTLWLAAASFVAGVATEFFTVVWETVNTTHIPERLLSRVGAHDEFWSFVPIPVSQLSTPFLAAAFGTASVAVLGGATAAVAMLLPLLVPALRRIEIHRQGE
ncbi:MFS transporter [Actinacidiphila guanduensis]|uniref:Transmembrane secretion effector n=1 Tax=Actinacidiphila guanduensis TaxID=310781 RepID=A0A1G9W387_9ACTN|nr:MFS transporter [Actinacidiphila guanduensis]SDM78989.1 Transmembrane secretion effector [Actinacidiphila guanduensis]